MSKNGTNDDQEVLVCHVQGLEAYSSNKTPVRNIPSDIPQWKQELLRKKEKEKLEKHKTEMARLYEESQIPEWMKPLKELHQRRKSEQSEKEEAERRKAEEERQRFEAMPAWKKQLIFKRRTKSAENLLSGCVKNGNRSEINSSKHTAEQNPEVGDESQVKENDDVGHDEEISDVNENEISNEIINEVTTNDEVEAAVDETENGEEPGKENEDVESEDGGVHSDKAESNEGQGGEVGDKIDEVGDKIDEVGDKIDEVGDKIDEVGDKDEQSNSDEQFGPDVEEKDNHDSDEVQKETDNAEDGGSDEVQLALHEDESEGKQKCSEDEVDYGTGEKTVEERCELEGVKNNENNGE